MLLWRTASKPLIGSVIWVAALVLALCGQVGVIEQQADIGKVLLLTGGALAAIAGLVQRAEPPGPEERLAATSLRRWCAPLPLSFTALGVLGCVAAAALVALGQRWTATWPWLLGLVALIAGAAVADHRYGRLSLPRPGRAAWREIALVAAILLVAVALRLPDLALVPPEIHADETSIGLEARRIFHGQLAPVFATGWYDVPALSFAIPALSMIVFGDDLFGLRMASVILGVLSVPLLYGLARRLFGRRVAAISAFLMAVAAMHVHFSRTGFHYMQALFATVLVLYLLVRGLQDGRLVDFVLCGLAVGLCFEVYYAARLAPVLAGAYLAHRLARERTALLRKAGPGLLAAGLVACVFLLPMAVVYAQAPGSFGSRASGVWLFNPENARHELDGYRVTSMADVLRVQADRTLEAFNVLGESSLQFARRGPLLDAVTGALFAMGVPLVTLWLTSSRRFLVSAWLWLTLLLGSILTVDALFSPHVIAMLPAVVLTAALALDTGWSSFVDLVGRAARYRFAAPVVVLLGVALGANVHDYFTVHVVEEQPGDSVTVLANAARVLNDRYRLYVVGSEDGILRHPSVQFLVPDADGVVGNGPLVLPLRGVPPAKGVAFLVNASVPEATRQLPAIEDAYPGASTQTFADARGTAVFQAILVPRAELEAANSSAIQD